MDDYALVINARSSGLRFCMYRRPDIGAWQRDARGEVEAIRHDRSAVEAVAEWVRSTYGDRVLGVGHRVAHGGARFTAPVLVTPFVLDELRTLERLAAFHHPHSLAALEAIAELLPGVPQVACFDTSFHRRRQAVREPTPLSREHRDAGLKRFGLHGLSYEHIASVLPQVAPDIADRRLIVAHLDDDDASVCAMTNRKSVDVIGMSGIPENLLQLLDLRDPDAHRRVDNFVYGVASGIAALAAASDGIDALVFTGGIGEASAEIRSRICDASAWLGIDVDEYANRAGGPRISHESSQVSAWLIPTNEELVVARHTAMLLGLVETHA